MEELIQNKKRQERFKNGLLSSIEQFRLGNDHLGLDHFLNCIADLEVLIEIDAYASKSKLGIDLLIPTMEKIHHYLQNQDVVALTDLLEFQLYPLIKQSFEVGDY
ncbi:hypothetical protein BKP37_05960 [Anaerobacillus alkalilacustris]|uniref:Uncharacterized protein n=1 Tax=Anaerobacillus alkalilacustris TaxID=393763 RepID=A0A1S2LYH9_9BACI|nr:hypothetical protein [Anaerobacillus alkalilacustris]OIJ16767.1 hypothetical protein BKP37_05960 [Anaerobacillus alkalilacustris]